MGVFTFTIADDTSLVAPARLFKALCLDTHNFMPKALPQFVKSVEFVQGDSTSVGCVKQLNFPEGSPFKYLKNRVDEIDEGNFYLKYTVIEGDVLGDSLEYAVYENKFEASGNGTHYNIVAHYHTKGDIVMVEEEITQAKEGIKKMYKVAEEHLIANPEVYARILLFYDAN